MQTIRIKRSAVSGTVPSVLRHGELALNTSDRELYFGDATGTVSKFQPNVAAAHVQDSRPAGTDGGTARKHKWNVRTFTNIVKDESSIIGLTGDDFTLIPGLYYVNVTASSHGVERHQLRLLDENHPGTVFYGNSSDGDVATLSCVLRSPDDGSGLFELQHYTDKGKERRGLGRASDDGTPEIYVNMVVLRICK